MALPLRHKKKNGDTYTRPPSIDAAIDAAIPQDLRALLKRAVVTDRSSPDYLPPECLVYLIRDARSKGEEATMGSLLSMLLRRCEARVKRKARRYPILSDEDIQEKILSDFALLFVEDDRSEKSELDFYECRFNLAFQTFLVDRVRSERRRLKLFTPLPREEELSSHTQPDGSLSVLREALCSAPNAIESVFLKECLKAISSLPPEEREAFVLCCLDGVKEDSEDPMEVTAAKLCSVTGRTIRNRLNRAKKKLGISRETQNHE